MCSPVASPGAAAKVIAGTLSRGYLTGFDGRSQTSPVSGEVELSIDGLRESVVRRNEAPIGLGFSDESTLASGFEQMKALRAKLAIEEAHNTVLQRTDSEKERLFPRAMRRGNVMGVTRPDRAAGNEAMPLRVSSPWFEGDGQHAGNKLTLAPGNDPFADPWVEEQKRRYTLEGMVDELGRGIRGRYDQWIGVRARALVAAAKPTMDDLQASVRTLKRKGIQAGVMSAAYVTTTAAINSPFTSPLSADLLTEWRDGSATKPRFFAYDSTGSRELFTGYSGDYYRNITRLGVSQLTALGHGAIAEGTEITIKNIPDFEFTDGAHGGRDGIHVGDVIGTFTRGVTATARGGYIYFIGENAMSLGSFAADNKLKHRQVEDPLGGSFKTTYQKFEWRIPIPEALRSKR